MQGPSLFDDVPSDDLPPDDVRPSSPPVLGVAELAEGIRACLEREFADVWVEGEISNFHRHRSGHCYFTLVDEAAQVRCVLWRHFTPYVFFEPKDGLLVRVHGKVSFYERRGTAQVVARSMQLAGEGALQRAFEQLKAKLAGEGLFEAQHKKPLPRFPETIGVVTSGSGAALQDVLSILERRFAAVRVLVCPVPVQGLGAAGAIAEAVEAFNAVEPGDPLRADLLIVGRGGGSAEDLWAFSEERVARALFASQIPIISAVGHETDVAPCRLRRGRPRRHALDGGRARRAGRGGGGGGRPRPPRLLARARGRPPPRARAARPPTHELLRLPPTPRPPPPSGRTSG